MSETRELLVFGQKTFKLRVPSESKITFGPFSPPTRAGYGDGRSAIGTLRIYAAGNEKQIIGVFTGVTGFRDIGLEYMEEVAVEEGAKIWKSDEKGYMREEKVKGERKWIVPEVPAIASDDDEEKEEVQF